MYIKSDGIYLDKNIERADLTLCIRDKIIYIYMTDVLYEVKLALSIFVYNIFDL